MSLITAFSLLSTLASGFPGAQGGDAPVRAVASALERVEPERMRNDIDTLANFGTRHSYSRTDSDTLGIGAAARWLEQEFESAARASGGRLQVGQDRFGQQDGFRIPDGLELVNVWAVLPGTRASAKGRHYYVLGHYDSRASRGNDAESEAPGANDDGSGTSVVLELARVLATSKLDASVVFLATAAEEQGLIGARYHVRRALEQGRDIRAALSNDIVGDPSGPPDSAGRPRMARDEVRLFSEGLPADADVRSMRRSSYESDSASRQLARFVAELGELHGLAVRPRLIHRLDRFGRGGDHQAFNDEGIAAVRFTEVFENFDRQHQDVREEDGVQYGDLPEFVDPEYLADVARLNLTALIHLANAPSSPPDAVAVLGGLSNDTRLEWQPSPEDDVAGYEIVWRATSASQWEHALDVGDVNEAVLELSMDNWFFGLRAYDEEGYRSPVAVVGFERR